MNTTSLCLALTCGKKIEEHFREVSAKFAYYKRVKLLISR